MRRSSAAATAAVFAFLLALAAVPAAQAGHRLLPNGALPTKLQQRPVTPSAAAFRPAMARGEVFATPGFTVGVPAGAPDGPCTQTAREGMPDHVGHNHRDPAQHRFACRLQQVAYLPLIEELGERPDVVFGEMDVKADIAAVSITYPTAGAVFFDVSDPAKPKFLDFYEGRECEQSALAVNCGAFVDLSADGKLAFIAVQTLGIEPIPDPAAPSRATPGVDVIDISEIREPDGEATLAFVQPGRPIATAPEPNVGGSHTARSHVIPEGPEGEGRDPGEYLFAVDNFEGVIISRVTGTTTEPVGLPLALDDIHDIFISNDAIDGRTYLYVAAGFASGFYVFDVTDPANPEFKAEWDPTPQCENDWYAHTIDVTYRGDRRYVTLPAELFSFGDQSEEDTAENCGTQIGNGDQVGPLWFVDASDFDRLGPEQAAASPTDGAESGEDLEKLRAASEETLITTWTNPAERAGGTFTFSPHNQQILGDTVLLSDYHGGVFALDASKAFSGTSRGPAARPTEIGFHTPHGTPVRPIRGVDEDAGQFDQGGDGFTEGLNRGEIWDAYAYKGHVFAADMIGGFYSLRLQDDPPAPPASPPATAAATPPAPVGGLTPPAQCETPARGLRTVALQRRSRGARLAFSRSVDRPVTVDVFQQTVGRRVVGERLVARFSSREGAVSWNGRANRRGRRVADGYLMARYTMALPGGARDVRRIPLRRVRGKITARPASERLEGCGIVRTFKLERPVLGGRTNRDLGISFRLNQDARVTVTVLRGSRVVKRFPATQRRARQLHRLRLDAEGLPRGDVRIRLQAGGTTATLTARRL
jgi:hypothetical protein